MNIFNKIKNIFNPKDNEILNAKVSNSFEIPDGEKESEVEIISSNNTMGIGGFRSVIDFDSVTNNIKQLIMNYREISLYPEVDSAIQEITNEAVVIDNEKVVSLGINSEEISKKINDKIKDEFNNIVKMLDFNNIGDEYFRQWYEDGRIYFHNIIDLSKPKLGIQDIKLLSPVILKKIKEEKTNKYFYVYKDQITHTVLKIPSEHITYCSSGMKSSDKSIFISYLHRAIKPFNQLKLLEDAVVIYRITRAPERRVFYVDVGQMNKSKAESYMANIMNKFKNKITYDSSTGKVLQQKNTMTMTEDFWLPPSESGSGSRGTRIDTLPAGQSLGELSDIQYFHRKLLKSLRVPYSRFDQEQPSMLGFGNMAGEMSRDEVRFTKFINKLRTKFGSIFLNILKKQLIFKNIITSEDWVNWKDSFFLEWNSDSYFSEIKESEITKNRVELAEVLEPFVDKYFSHEYVMKEIFKMTEEEIEIEKKRMSGEEETDEFEDDDNGDEDDDDNKNEKEDE